MLKKWLLLRLTHHCRIQVQLFLPHFCFPVPSTSSQTSLEAPFARALSKCLLKMPLPNLSTSTVLGTMTTHKNNHFQGDHCLIWELQPLPTTLIHITWQDAGGSSFLRLPARLVPNFWLNIKKFTQCKTIPITLHLLGWDALALWQPVRIFLPHFCAWRFVLATQDPFAEHIRSRWGLWSCPWSLCSFPWLHTWWVTLSGEFSFRSCHLSSLCALRALCFLMDFLQVRFIVVRSRSAFRTQCYNMLQWSWFLEHSSPLKRQINPWTIHHTVFGVAVKSFNTLQVSFPSTNFASEEIQLRAFYKGLKIHVLFSLPKKCFTTLKSGPLKFCTLSSLHPVVGKPSPIHAAELNSSRHLALADFTEKGQQRGGGLSHSPACLGVRSQNFQ